MHRVRYRKTGFNGAVAKSMKEPRTLQIASLCSIIGGHGYVDKNLSFEVDNEEKKVYFEFSDYSTNDVFHENYKD